MKGYGVIVEYSQLVDGANEDLSCSGMYLGHGIVLTHGTLLADLLKDKKAQPVIEELSAKGYCTRMRQSNFLSSILEDVQGKFRVILPSVKLGRETVSIDCEPCAVSGIESYPQIQNSKHGKSKPFLPHTESDSFLSAGAHIDRIILQSGVNECLQSLMPASQRWKLLEENQSCIHPDLERLIISTFVLLRLSEKDRINEEPDNTVIDAVKEIMSLFIPVHKGSFVYVESSPFGSASPSIFLNSLSHGIICNTGIKGHEVLLTDARCITGSEGAPVFVVVSEQRRLCALVISPFCWRGGEWLGLTLLASLGPILETLLQSYTSVALALPKKLYINNKKSYSTGNTTAAIKPQPRNGFMDENLMEGTLKDICKSVVCIKCGGGWGSGVVVSTSPGIILTCAHVTYKAINKEVTVLLSDGRRTQGTVIYQTQPLITCQEGTRPPTKYSMWDLAVVVTSSPLSHALSLATNLPPQGVGAVVAGYGMFPSWILPTATLSRGVISKVITIPSSSLHLPPSLAKGGSSKRHTSAADDSDGNLSLDDTLKKKTTTRQHNFSVKRCPQSSGDRSHCLMKLGRLPSGTIRKCIPVPVVIQTSCAVYAGGSGGPVVTIHPTHGLQVVGMVVCNMQDSNSITFPHVNLAIPIPTIATILHTFFRTRNATVLQYLDIECAAASHLWGLAHPLWSCL